MAEIDPVSSVRKGEAFDLIRFEKCFKQKLPRYEGDLQVKQFPGGHSNLTYLIQAGDHELVLRRPPFGSKVKSAHDMEREYRVLSALSPVFPQAPKPVLLENDLSVMGCQFLIMERIRGTVIRKNIPDGLVYTKDSARELCKNMIGLLFRLHKLDYQDIGLEDFGRPVGYIRRQVEGWTKRYQAAITPDAPDCEDIMAWLAENLPPDPDRPGLIHGDFKLDNLVLDPDDPEKICGILDWEMATIGDPLADMAYALIYWPESGDEIPPPYDTLPPMIRNAVSREELLAYYEELSGKSIEHMDFYYSFNLFRLGAIIQQIYYRYHQGLTKDERFAALKQIVARLMTAASGIIGKS